MRLLLVTRTRWFVMTILLLTIQKAGSSSSSSLRKSILNDSTAIRNLGANNNNNMTEEEYEDCLNAFVNQDDDKNDHVDRPEYVAVVQELSLDQILHDSFQQLPPILRRNFIEVYLETSSNSRLAWNVYGSKPEQRENATLDQIAFLKMACQETYIAIDTVLQQEGIHTPTDVPSLSPSPSQSPSTLAAPSSLPTVTTMTNDNITLETLECYYALSFSDADQDDWMNQTEYVTLLHQYSNFISQNTPFDELPLLLQVNFMYFVNDTDTEDSITMMMSAGAAGAGAAHNVFVHDENDKIWIYGARYPLQKNATQAQYENLQLLCSQTKLVLESLQQSQPTPMPTIAPTPSMTLAIPSEFTISNQVGLTASNLTVNNTLVELEAAHDVTAQQVVLQQENATRQQQQQVDYVEGSGSIDNVQDTACPNEDDDDDATTDTWCQSVSASFLLILQNDDESSLDTVKGTYMTAMDAAIQGGLWQQNLLVVNPNSPILVVTNDDDDDEEDDDNIYEGGFEKGNERDETTFWIVLTIVCAGQAVFVGMAVFVCLKREDMELAVPLLKDNDKKQQDIVPVQDEILPPSTEHESEPWDNGVYKPFSSNAVSNFLSHDNVSLDEPPPGAVPDLSTSSSNVSPLQEDDGEEKEVVDSFSY